MLQKWKKRLLRCFWGLMVLLAVSLLARNWMARIGIQAIASSYLGSQVKVGSVFIGLRVIQLENIQVYLGNPEANKAQPAADCRVGIIRLTPTLSSGLQDGIWCDELVIDAPQLDLSFDLAGKLLTVFPDIKSQSSSSETKIPVRHVLIKRAQLTVKQPSKNDLCLVADQISARFTDQVQIAAQVNDFLGGHVTIDSTLNLASLEGTTQIQVRSVKIDSRQLANLPLVPGQVNQFPASAQASLQATVVHPAHQQDFRLHDLSASATISHIQSKDLPTPPIDIRCDFQNQQGHLTAVAKTNLLGGQGILTATTDLSVPTVQVHGKLLDVHLEQLRPTIAALTSINLPPFTTTVGAVCDATVGLQSSQCQLTSSLTLHARQISAYSISIGNLGSSFSANARIPLDAPNAISGHLEGAYRWEGINVGQLPKAVLPLKATGRVVSEGRFSLPFTTQPDLSALDTRLTVNWNDIGINDLSITDSCLSVSSRHGQARIEIPETMLLGTNGWNLGQFAGTVSASLTGDHPIAVHVVADRIGLPALAQLAGANPADFSGTVSITANAGSSLSSVTQVTSWHSDVILSTSQLGFQTETVQPITVHANLANGNLQVPEFDVCWRGTRCQLAAEGSVIASPLIAGRLTIVDSSLTDVAAAARNFSDAELPIAGSVNVTGGFRCQLAPLAITAGGQIIANETTFGNTRIGTAQLDWSADQDGLIVGSGSDDFFGGGYRIDARLRGFDWTQATVHAGIRDLQVARLASLSALPLPVTGTVSGQMQASHLRDLSTLQVTGSLTSSGVSLQRIPIEIIESTLQLKHGLVNLTSRGQVSGGEFQIDVDSNLVDLQNHFQQQAAPIHAIPISLQASLNSLTLSSLARHLQLPRSVMGLQGTIQANCVRNAADHDAGQLCHAVATLENITWNRSPIADRISGELQVSPNRLQLSNLSGRIADGQLSGSADIILENRPRGMFQMQLSRINLRRVSRAMRLGGKDISGTASIGIDGRIGNTISGNLRMNAQHLVASDLMVRQVAIPVDWSYSQSARSVKWRCRNGMVEAGNGKIYFSTDGDFSRSLNAQLSARLEGIDSGKLIRGKSFGAGIVNGSVNLQATRARSPQHISGNFALTLKQIQALEMPVLDKLPSIVQVPSVGVTTSAQQNNGEFRGRVANAVVYVDDAYVSQSNIHVLLTGRSTLDGNLNFDVTASTQQSGPIDDLLALADSPLMMAGPAPVAMLAKANEAMKNRVVHIQLTGNANRPILRLQPGKQLSQEAIRFFIRSSLPTKLADVAERSTDPRRR